MVNKDVYIKSPRCLLFSNAVIFNKLFMCSWLSRAPWTDYAAGLSHSVSMSNQVWKPCLYAVFYVRCNISTAKCKIFFINHVKFLVTILTLLYCWLNTLDMHDLVCADSAINFVTYFARFLRLDLAHFHGLFSSYTPVHHLHYHALIFHHSFTVLFQAKRIRIIVVKVGSKRCRSSYLAPGQT